MTKDRNRKKKVRAFAAKNGMSYMAAHHALLASNAPPSSESKHSPQLIAGFFIDYGHGDLVEHSHDRPKAEKFIREETAPAAPIAFCSVCDLFVCPSHFDECEPPEFGVKRRLETHPTRAVRERKDLRRRQPADRIATRNLFLPATRGATILHRGTDDKDIHNPTLAEILRELGRLTGGQDSFVIYGPDADAETYMQVLGAAKEGFQLEYRAGSGESHFAARKLLTLEEVQNAFLWYASGDERWKVDIAWAKHAVTPPERQQIQQPSIEIKDFYLTKRRLEGDYPKSGDRAGKWLIFVDRDEVDGWWQKISAAIDAGVLGGVAQVSTVRPNRLSPNPSRHVICVFTYDSADRADVARIRGALRDLGVTEKIAYKTNQATREGRYKVRGDKNVALYWE